MELIIEVSGDVVDRQELLNGTQSVDIAGADERGDWSLSASISWNVGLLDYEGEGHLDLERSDGAEIFASITRAHVQTATEQADAEYTFELVYEIDAGTRAFLEIDGTAHAEGVLAGDTFRGTWTLALSAT